MRDLLLQKKKVHQTRDVLFDIKYNSKRNLLIHKIFKMYG